MYKNLVILCKSAKEEKKALEKLEKAGNKWVSGNKATEKSHYHGTDYALVVCYDEAICYSTNARKYKKGYTNDCVVNCEVVTAKEFTKENECIVIYRKGNETIALDKTTGKKAVAKCSPEDEYDFTTGAKLAFERLTEPEVREVKRMAKAGEYVKIIAPTKDASNDYKKGDILKIVKSYVFWDKAYYKDKCGKYCYKEEYVVLEGYQPPEEEKEPEFKPCLRFASGSFYGYIGEPTPLKDVIGRELRIGDTVELYNDKNEYIDECVVVRNSKYGCKAYVCGIEARCQPDGFITGGYKIILKRKHEDIKNGEEVDEIKYLKERA